MRFKRSRLSLFLLVIAITTTLVFLLSTVFTFGISTHRSTFLSWNASTPGYGLVQVICIWGQFHITIDFATPGARPRPPLAPRSWHAGAQYFRGIHTDLKQTDRWASKVGADAFLIQSGTYFGAGVFGLYPAVLAWLLVWLTRKKLIAEGHCVGCGYDMRATPDRCPECGRVPEKSHAAVP